MSRLAYRIFVDKLFFIGTELSHKRHKILLEKARCLKCGYFHHLWAANNFVPYKKPDRCSRCGTLNVFANVVDPLNEMVKQVEKTSGKKFKSC